MFTLYNYVLSGNCYKVRLMAALLGIEYNTVAVDFHPGLEHKSAKFLALNPDGTLPVLVSGDVVFTDSNAMLLWMVNTYDKTGNWLENFDPVAIEKSSQWLAFASELSVTVGELRLHSMLNREIDVSRTTRAAKSVLRRLEAYLTEQSIRGKAWLVGADPSVADIACFPYAALSPDAGIEHDAYPAIRDWLYEVRSLEKFITMPGIHALHELR